MSKINNLTLIVTLFPSGSLMDPSTYTIKSINQCYKTNIFKPKKSQYNGARAPECFIDDKYVHRKGRR